MEQTQYDVFISYSRKDYAKDDVVIPGNPITAIMNLFDENGISYWIDKDGIYVGKEFPEVISDAIASSKMLVFVSSKHSNDSKWTTGEIFEAHDGDKLIIPVRIDDCPYNKKFRMLVRPLDFVDYQAQPNTALPKLLLTVKKEKERIEKIEADSTRLEQIEAAKKEIRDKAKEYQALAGQQDYILRALYAKNKLIGITIKRCPVCGKEEPIRSQFCSQCGWQFPKLYGIDDGNVPLHDEAQLAIARKCWQGLGSVATLQKENDSLEEKNAEIEKMFQALERKQKEEEDRRKAEEAKRQEEMRGVYTVNGVSFKMIRVEGDTFKMGATPEQGSVARNNEEPVHQVTLSDYFIGETQVTQALWQAVMGRNPSVFKGANRPVENVGWDDSQKFISKLNKLTGKRFRLPTEAEWEFAARGGKKSKGYKYSGSNNIDEVAWYWENSDGGTKDVKTKSANELGLYDMSGNVWEWCNDWYDDYPSSPQTNPQGLSSGSYRVSRGGSWISIATYCRAAYRYDCTPADSYSGLGLRLAL